MCLCVSQIILIPSQMLAHHTCIQHRSSKQRKKSFSVTLLQHLKSLYAPFQSLKSPTTSLQVYFLSSIKVYRLDSVFTNPRPLRHTAFRQLSLFKFFIGTIKKKKIMKIKKCTLRSVSSLLPAQDCWTVLFH